MSVGAQTPRFSNTALRIVASDWRVSGIFSARSGSWLTVTTARDIAGTGIVGQRLNQVSDEVYGDKSLTNYFNVAAFAYPAAGTFGNHVRNSIEGPGFWTVDLALSRLVRIASQQTLELRLEAFNLLNHVNWAQPHGELRFPQLRPDHRHHRQYAHRPVWSQVWVLDVSWSRCAPLIAFVRADSLSRRLQELPRRLGGDNGPARRRQGARESARCRNWPTARWTCTACGGTAATRASANQLKPGELDSIMLPWAKQMMATRKETDNPYFYCMPGGPLRLTGGFGWRFLQHPTVNAKHIFQMQEGNSHVPADLHGWPQAPGGSDARPGMAIRSDDGKAPTLVIDTIGLNDKFWIDRPGTPHTEQLHMIERWTRDTFMTLQRAVTVDDPGAFTSPFTVNYEASLATKGRRSWSTSASRTISTGCRTASRTRRPQGNNAATSCFWPACWPSWVLPLPRRHIPLRSATSTSACAATAGRLARRSRLRRRVRTQD